MGRSRARSEFCALHAHRRDILERALSTRTCSCVYRGVRGALLVLAVALLAACPGGSPDSEHTMVDGRSVFLIQKRTASWATARRVSSHRVR
jgi:hypothetical protein